METCMESRVDAGGGRQQRMRMPCFDQEYTAAELAEEVAIDYPEVRGGGRAGGRVVGSSWGL